jgi:hypothetical protein
MTDEQTQISEQSDWRNEVSEGTATMKVLDGETKNMVFMNEGVQRTSADYGTSIAFDVESEEEKKTFYVKANNFSLLKQIKELGTLTGQAVKVSRTGSKKSDTRYTIEKIEETA